MSKRTKLSLRRLSIYCSLALFSACAVGVDAGDEPLIGGGVDPALGVDTGVAPPPAVIDAGPTYAPLPPNLGLPQDSGLPPLREGGVETRAPLGGGGTRGAGGTDAGSSSGGSRTPTTSTTRDAGSARGGTTTTTGCQPSRCTNTCGLDGPINCCTLLDTCGCTWAPGAYCL
jgi:hypothetical protein